MSDKAYCIDLEDLRKACKFSLCVDPASKTIKLNAEASVKDSNGKKHKFKRTMNITPLVKQLSDRLYEIEDRLGTTQASGDLSVTVEHAGGWLSDTYGKAVRIAKSIGENRIVRDIYEDILPEVAPFIPGASAALAITHKAHDLLVRAREGQEEAVEKVHHLVEAAKTSGPARQVVSMMHRMKQLMAMKQEYSEDAVSGDLFMEPPFDSEYDDVEEDDDIDEELDDQVGGWHWIWDRPKKRKPRSRVRRHHVTRHDEYVEGWLYNKPYRDPMTAMMELQKDPGTIHRFLYNRGMGRG